MLYGMPDTDILTKLANSIVAFYLTGSRHFGTNDENADWDFFACNQESTVDVLEDLGFKRLDKYDEGAPDRLLYEVYRLVADEISIDVQLVTDVATKRKSQRIIRDLGLFQDDICRAQQIEIWDTLCAAIQS